MNVDTFTRLNGIRLFILKSLILENVYLVLIQHLYLENCHYTEYVAILNIYDFLLFPSQNSLFLLLIWLN